MGSDTFEATVHREESAVDVKRRRDNENRRLAAETYRRLVNEGRSPASAAALVNSIFFADDPNPVTMTFVEHTGVFGLWHEGEKKWLEADSVIYGPRCVMEAEMLTIHEPLRGIFSVREFAPDGTPIIEDEAKSPMVSHETMPQGNPLDIAGPIIHYGCYACGSTGHMAYDCPERQPR